jgi:hypothetical protein
MSKTITEFCKQHGLTEAQFYGREKFGGSLYLRGLTSIPEGFNPTVGGSLYLSGLTSIPEGFNPTVGGDLYLSGLTSIPEGFNPTVGGYLDLSGLTSIPEGFNPTVGGSLYLRGLTSDHTPLNNRLLFWRDGKYVLADGIFTEVISKKGRVYTVKNIGSDRLYYLATDGKSTHAHGDTVEQAKADLRFKLIAEKLKNDPIKPDTIITIPYYRAVTGACETGVRQWMDSTFTQDQKADILANGITAEKLLPILKKKNAWGVEKFQSLAAF